MKAFGTKDAADEFMQSSIRQSMKKGNDSGSDDD